MFVLLHDYLWSIIFLIAIVHKDKGDLYLHLKAFILR